MKKLSNIITILSLIPAFFITERMITFLIIDDRSFEIVIVPLILGFYLFSAVFPRLFNYVVFKKNTYWLKTEESINLKIEKKFFDFFVTLGFAVLILITGIPDLDEMTPHLIYIISAFAIRRFSYDK